MAGCQRRFDQLPALFIAQRHVFPHFLLRQAADFAGARTLRMRRPLTCSTFKIQPIHFHGLTALRHPAYQAVN